MEDLYHFLILGDFIHRVRDSADFVGWDIVFLTSTILIGLSSLSVYVRARLRAGSELVLATELAHDLSMAAFSAAILQLALTIYRVGLNLHWLPNQEPAWLLVHPTALLAAPFVVSYLSTPILEGAFDLHAMARYTFVTLAGLVGAGSLFWGTTFSVLLARFNS